MDESFEMVHAISVTDEDEYKRRGSTNSLVWDNFEQVGIVGKGSFGTAILCRRKKDQQLVILKEVNLQDLSVSQRPNARREAELLSILNHPNIVAYFGCYNNHCQILIEMEYCEGGTLAQFLSRQKQPLLETDILSIFRQIASALEYLDDKNILHRDLKAGNIFITKQNVIKIGDFGIAKILSTQSPAASTVIGTPLCFSPEVCQGRRYTKKSDIWAAGCVLYELTCLRKTFESSSLPALINKIVKGQFAPIRAGYSVGLRRLINDLLQKDPDLRPRAFEVVNTVDQLLTDAYVMKMKMNPLFDPFSGSIFTQNVINQFHQRQKTYSILLKLTIEPIIHLEAVPGIQDILVKYISLSESHMLLLTESSSVFLKHFGEKSESLYLINQLEQKNIIKVQAGNGFSVFLTQTGLIYTSGSRCLGRSESRLHLLSPPEIVNSHYEIDFVDIAAGHSHVLACSRSGDVYVWGLNRSGCLGIGDEESQFPMLLPLQARISKVFAGKDASAFVDTKGCLWACGCNAYGKLGLMEGDVNYPQKVLLIKQAVISVTIGPVNSVLLLTCGRIVTLGLKYDTNYSCNYSFHSIGSVTSVSCGSSFILTTNSESEVHFWGQRRRCDDNIPSERIQCLDNLLIGRSNVSLMEVVSQYGPDFPVVLVREPRVVVKSMKELIKATEKYDSQNISEPNVIVAVYGSQAHLKLCPVTITQVACNSSENTAYLLIETDFEIKCHSVSDEKGPKVFPQQDASPAGQRSVRFNDLATWIESSTVASDSSTMDHTMTWIKNEFKSACKKDESKSSSSQVTSRRFIRSASEPLLYTKETRESLQGEHKTLLELDELRSEVENLKSQLLDLRQLRFELQEETVRLRRRESLRAESRCERRFVSRWICCPRI